MSRTCPESGSPAPSADLQLIKVNNDQIWPDQKCSFNMRARLCGLTRKTAGTKTTALTGAVATTA